MVFHKRHKNSHPTPHFGTLHFWSSCKTEEKLASKRYSTAAVAPSEQVVISGDNHLLIEPTAADFHTHTHTRTRARDRENIQQQKTQCYSRLTSFQLESSREQNTIPMVVELYHVP